MEMDWTLSGVVPCRALLPLGHSFRGRYHRDPQCLGELRMFVTFFVSSVTVVEG